MLFPIRLNDDISPPTKFHSLVHSNTKCRRTMADLLGEKKRPVKPDVNFENLEKVRTKCISNTSDHRNVYNSL